MVESTDVLVIGGGIVGAATAYQLAQAGRVGDAARGGPAGVRGDRPEPRLHLGPHPPAGTGARARDGDPERARRTPRGARRRLRPAHERRPHLRHDRGAGRRHARVRRTPDGGRRPDALARWRRGTGHRADPARHGGGAPRSARSTRRSTPRRYVRAFAAAAQRPRRPGRRGRHRTDVRDATAAGSRGSRPTSARSRPARSSSPPAPGRPYLAAQLGIELHDPPDAAADRPDRADAAASRRRHVRAGGGQAVRALPRPPVLPSGVLRDRPRGPARAGPARVGLPDRRRLVPARHRDGLPGLRLEAGPGRRLARRRGDGSALFPSSSPPVSPGPGRACCR